MRMQVAEDFLWERLGQTKKPVLLYGMGDGADKILQACKKQGVRVAGIFASDEFVRGQEFHGFGVKRYCEAKAAFPEMVVLVAFGTQRPEVVEKIRRIGEEQELYAPDVEVVSGAAFTRGLYESNREKLEEAYGMLADGQSKKTFQAVLNYKISGKISYLFDCEAEQKEIDRNVLCLSDEEVYVDAGAYNGDTLADYLAGVGGYKRVLAIEPDQKNFKKLCAAVEGLPRVICKNAALADRDGRLGFDALAGRQSAVRERAQTQVEACAIDTVAPDATYIKMDVEGYEMRALAGARQTICLRKPKMLIAAYHRHVDLFALPLAVKKLRGDYRVYLRHLPCIPAWDTNYYFV